MAAIGSVGARLAHTALVQDRGSIRMKLGGIEGDQPSFADTLKQALGDVQELQTRSQDAIGSFLRGEPVEIHDVMAAAEEAGIALDMLIEIRNKLTDAYRSVIQMQA
ncbi:MAG: flagellar hook-basal body complex protein FliE [Gemmatimonadota bacterium]|nr:flagellar hook-basal body complex protein FliE [Gemmatimonadota bacterium]MDH5758241.1 flagellar hook-basal body complex protein FliE [Gemmatimonadota bacterium]